MAEVAAIVVPIIQPLINKLSSRVWREMEMIRSVEKDLEKLKERLETINSVLVDAERRSVRDEALRGWLKKIKDAALDADDVVDAFQTEALRRSHLINLNVKGKVRDFFSPNNPLKFHKKMAREIKDVNNRIDGLVRLRKDFNLNEGSPPPSSSEVVLGRETYSYVDESKICGREEDKEHIINLLVNVDNDKNLSVLPIVGLGGLGKTTLAKLVFNDGRIQEHFEKKKWVFVGKEFKIMDIISALVKDTSEDTSVSTLEEAQQRALVKDTSEDTSVSTLEEAQQRLRAKLGGKKFLLVLDDVWNENADEWEEIEDLLKCGKLASKIIVTTRDEGVAKIMITTETPYKLEGLSDEECWDLFRRKAFGPGGKAKESDRLIEIGKEIVEKCGGLPLAVKSLGGLMASKRGEQEWLDIRDSDIWKLSLKDVRILPSLILSYDHLPSNLKQCFAYCSVFPKDLEFERLKLIQFWTAEGFIQSSREEVPVEDVGSDYFDILLQRSFLQNEEENDFGEVISCKMHDLVHDLACLVSKGEFSTVHATENKISLTGRYSSVIYDDDIDKLALHIDNETKKLRSLHVLGFYGVSLSEFELGPKSLVTHLRVLDLSGTSMEVVPKIVGKLKHLRFLDISFSKIKELPESVCSLYNLQTLNLSRCGFLERLPEGIENLRSLRHLDMEECSLTEMPSGIDKLKHLRFLDISFSEIKELPKSVCRLYNLQTLNLRNCTSLERLSEGIENLRRLRHLDIEGCYGLTEMPSGIGRLLRELQTLPLFIVDERCRISELQNLISIRGEFTIKIRSRMDPREAKDANLGDKANIHSLVLEWMDPSFEDEEGAVENLRPHPNLKHLSIVGYGGSMLPNWVGEASVLPNLKKLFLFSIDRCESLPSLGQLPCLERLKVCNMPRLRRMGEEVYGDDGGVLLFPSLKYLHLEELDDLEEWLVVARNGIIMFPLLEELMIYQCPKLRLERAHLPSSLVKLEMTGIDEELLSAGVGGILQGLSRLTDLKIERVKPSSNSSTEWKGIQHLTALRSLEITRCDGVTKLPEGVLQLPSLQNLRLWGNRGLNSLGQRRPLFYTSLLRLTLQDCDDLIALPEWVGDLTSLRDLSLSDCPKLEQLPDGLQRLTGLQQLHIWDCRLLRSRCEKETGEDWHKIAHIPNIQIK